MNPALTPEQWANYRGTVELPGGIDANCTKTTGGMILELDWKDYGVAGDSMQVPAEALPGLLALINRALTYNGGPSFTRTALDALRKAIRLVVRDTPTAWDLLVLEDVLESILPPGEDATGGDDQS